MDDHLGILQEGIEAAAVGAERAFEQSEGLGGEIDQRKKENLYGSENDRGVSEKTRIGFISEAKDKTVSGKQKGPEHQRAFLAGP